MKVFLVVGARPNFMKIAPVLRESLKYSHISCKTIHTGQHYDYEMSKIFFEDLKIPAPDFFLNAGSGSHAVQTGKIMVAFEKLCQDEKPDLAIVVGDVNSTLACSIVAKKLLIKVAHIEAGLRSFDLTMPEEINRIVTDSISDLFFVTEESAIENLLREGRKKDAIHFVGNVMIDNLFYQLNELGKEDTTTFSTYELKKEKDSYVFLTLHRPSNVDQEITLKGIVSALNTIAEERIIFFPAHPRTKKMLAKFKTKLHHDIKILEPLGFKESLFLWKDAVLVMTDSGGLQEETTALGVPCITLRENTERPITVSTGTNILAGTTKKSIIRAYRTSLKHKSRSGEAPPKWDGRASERIWKVILNKDAS
jgi:UDP-N-acetylglucosamine 2-epimerase (non-hydrolysing)